MPKLSPSYKAPAQPIKWPGGKHYLASRIVSMLPPRDKFFHYVEPYAGGLSVLLANDPEGISEVVGDLNGGLTNFWRVLQGNKSFCIFQRMVEAMPFSQAEWCAVSGDEQPNLPDDGVDVNHAVRFFVRCRQSLAGREKAFAPLSKTRIRRGMNEQASAWISAVDGLPMVHARLRRVVVLTGAATDVILNQDSLNTVFYLDPPYLHDTRTSIGEYGDNEMDAADHLQLLRVIKSVKGAVLLSGYRSRLYDEELIGWDRVEFDLPNNAAGGSEKRRMIECVWRNERAASQ